MSRRIHLVFRGGVQNTILGTREVVGFAVLFGSKWWHNGAPEEIRTPDPQIRSSTVRQRSRRSKYRGRLHEPLADVSWALAIDLRSQLSHRGLSALAVFTLRLSSWRSTALPRAKFLVKFGAAKAIENDVLSMA